MKFSKALILLSSIVAVLSDGHNNASDSAKEHSSDDALVISTNLLLDEVSEEILIEVQAVHNSSIVPADAVYDIAFEVVEKHGDEDDKIQAILGHMTDAVSELELIHTGESGSVSDILAEIISEYHIKQLYLTLPHFVFQDLYLDIFGPKLKLFSLKIKVFHTN